MLPVNLTLSHTVEINITAVVNKVIYTDTVTINPKQNLDLKKLEFAYFVNNTPVVGTINVYENTGDSNEHYITISSADENMLNKVFKFYKLNTPNAMNWNDNILSSDTRLQILNVEFVPAGAEDAYIKITYKVTNHTISADGVNILISGVPPSNLTWRTAWWTS